MWNLSLFFMLCHYISFKTEILSLLCCYFRIWFKYQIKLLAFKNLYANFSFSFVSFLKNLYENLSLVKEGRQHKDCYAYSLFIIVVWRGRGCKTLCLSSQSVSHLSSEYILQIKIIEFIFCPSVTCWFSMMIKKDAIKFLKKDLILN